MTRDVPARRRVLAVGISTLDIVCLVDHYPAEDGEVRALSERRGRGGNASNMLVVLSQMGYRCSWVGTLAGDPDSRYILDDMERYAIDTAGCVRYSANRVPTSYVWISRRNGSRTIVHYRDLPELRLRDFERIDLARFDWVHFEGRNPQETAAMIALVRRRRPDLPVSLEVEKARDGIEALFHGPDILLFSKAFAMSRGYSDGGRFLEDMRPATDARIRFCAWGANGAYAAEAGAVLYTPAFRPPAVRDTLGAGDVFNAAVIDGLLRRLPLSRVLENGCRLAGRKCAIDGFAGLLAENSR